MVKIRFLALFLILTACLFRAEASVVMTGTRIIFPSSSAEKTLQFKNPDDWPVIMQLRITKEQGEPDNNAPFSIVPPVFRMEPHSGQAVRLIANGQTLPTDRESVFYFDFVQLPATKKSDKNELIIAVRNRVKIFYRPVNLPGNQSDAYQQLVIRHSDGKLTVTNPTGYFITIRKAAIATQGASFPVADSVMIPPQSTQQWPLSKKVNSEGARLMLTLVNDYGADIVRERKL